VKLLITGASGLVGGRLIQHLLAAGGVEIRAASRVRRDWPASVEGCVADLGQPGTLEEACRGTNAVINLASMAERFCSLDPQAALRVNGGGTLSLASAAAAAGVLRFVQVSSCKIYGDNLQGAVTEETPPRPRSHYAITHRLAEDYAISQQANCVVVRLANGFGAPVDARVDCWDIIVNQMCRQAVVDRQIVIRSSGRAWRNFVPMQDVVRALQYAIEGAPAGIYNMGAPHSMTLAGTAEQVAVLCEKTFGWRPSIKLGPGAPGERNPPLDYRSEKLARTGFASRASFEEEVTATLLMAMRGLGVRPVN
jgi:UDP-glucose 4-epimerase